VQAEVDARSVSQGRLKSTHAELRSELDQLIELVEQEGEQRTQVESKAVVMAAQLAELEEQLADLTASRDKATGAASGLREELERLRAIGERDAAQRAQVESRAADLVVEVGAVREQLAGFAAAREEAVREASGLRTELDRLRAVVDDASSDQARLQSREKQLTAQVSDLRSGLATMTVSSEAAESEVAGLRAELDRLGAELGVAREQSRTPDAGLGEAESLLVEARAVTARMKQRLTRWPSEPSAP
jgi:chromosome segregation ATPase